MAPHSSALAWKIPGTEEPGRLQSMGSLRVGHDWATSLSLFTCMHWRRKWQPIPVFLPGESRGRGSLVGCHLWGHTIPGSGRSPGEGNGNPLPYSCLENSMDRGAWWDTVHGSQRIRQDLAMCTSALMPRGHLHTVTHTDRMPGEEEAEGRVLLLQRTPKTVSKISEAGGAAMSSACPGAQRTQPRPHCGPPASGLWRSTLLWFKPPSLCSFDSVSLQMIQSSYQGSSDNGVRTDRGGLPSGHFILEDPVCPLTSQNYFLLPNRMACFHPVQLGSHMSGKAWKRGAQGDTRGVPEERAARETGLWNGPPSSPVTRSLDLLLS